MRKAAAKQTEKFGHRVRFNWGYHDGADDAKRGGDRRASDTRPLPSSDHAYGEGYGFGHRAQSDGVYAKNSTTAWEASFAATQQKG